jgi:hypothetical protein
MKLLHKGKKKRRRRRRGGRRSFKVRHLVHLLNFLYIPVPHHLQSQCRLYSNESTHLPPLQLNLSVTDQLRGILFLQMFFPTVDK